MVLDTTQCWRLHDELQELINRIEQTVLSPPDLESPVRHEISNSLAMNSTKRKFNTLLNSIGTSSTDDLTSKAKQQRTSYEGSPRPASARLDLSTSSRTAAVSKMSKTDLKSFASGAKKSLTEAVVKPTYLPGDREEFLKRLSSFRNISDWMPKPPKVNEVAWAKRGWVCQRLERVRCITCNVEIKVKLNKQEDEDGKVVKFAGQEKDIEQALVDKYAELMISSHDSLCPWRKRGCDDSIFKQPIYPVQNTFSAFKSRYESFLPMADKLPSESVFKLPEGFNLDEIIPQFPPNFVSVTENTASESSSDLHRVALLMSLFGFTARPDYVPKLGAADCRICFRNIGLWLHRPKGVSDKDGGDPQKSPAIPSLNPLECHRDYCPWINAQSQNPGAKGIDAKPIWRILKEVIEKDYVSRHHDELPSGKSESKKVAEARMDDSQQVAPTDAKDEGDYEKQREEKDKERWARLRKVKSLFEVKGKKVTKEKH